MLTSLYVSCELSNTNLSLVASIIPRTCPALKELNIRSYRIPTPGLVALSSCLRALHSLESVSISIPDLLALEHLGGLQTLSRLSASLLDVLSASPQISALPFIALERLLLRGETKTLAYFFRKSSAVTLKNVDVELYSPSTAAAIDGLHNALKEGCVIIDLQSLQSLFCFVNITPASINSYVEFNLDDEGMERVALAWPQITVLHFQSGPLTGDSRLQPSLRCLRILAQHCRALKDLAVTLNATFIPDPDPSDRIRTSHLALDQLDVGNSSISPQCGQGRDSYHLQDQEIILFARI
ncbi:hypothetical protein B0H14DRAFT_3454179 [Mycena olivaceomarginata]|nr:hypothetical protein B0H14DRAFT_3454179 [Mycena olivaceomarginata]